MRARPRPSMTGPMSLSTAPRRSAGRAADSAIVRRPPREVPTKMASSIDAAVRTASHVGELDLDVVVPPVAVVLGAAAAAVVEGEHAPGPLAVLRQGKRKLVKIGGGAREPR